MADKSIFIDTTKCIACRGCQIGCKQWNRNEATKTYQKGSHQNPPDLSVHTFKVVRFNEVITPEGELRWYFFPEQCRHCINPPCKEVADSKVKGAILIDEPSGAVLFNQKVRVKESDFKEISEMCPYNVPRFDPKTGRMAKCTMCVDRIREGLQPACVKACPTGAMFFGDRKDVLEKAKERLTIVKKLYPKARLLDADSVRIIYLVIDDPKRYYQAASSPLKAKTPFAQILRPLEHLELCKVCMGPAFAGPKDRP